MKPLRHHTLSALVILALANLVFGETTETPKVPQPPNKPVVENDSASEEQVAKKTAKKERPRYIRISHDDDGEPIALEVAVTRFKSADEHGPCVDLIGAVHIAEPGYYAKLNKMFRRYDAVLYELVAPAGTTVPRGGTRPTSGVGFMQSGMTQMLGLSYQLDKVDYTKRNFVHADISPGDFSKSMKDRGESLTQVLFRMIGRAIAQDADGGRNTESEIDLLSALLSRDRDFALKRTMAKQFEDMEGAISVFEGRNGSTIVSVRNKKAVDILEKEIKQGRKKLAIFYGAAHMPDMAERITKRLKMQPAGEPTWMMAWDLRRPEKEQSPNKK